MPSQWNHKADKDLLLAIIEDGHLKSINWTSIAKKMQLKKYTFSHEACRQHFQKIRKESNSGGLATPPKQKTSSTSGTGSKRKNTSKLDSFASSNGLDDNNDDDEKIDTPSKKCKVDVEFVKKELKEEYSEQIASLFKHEDDFKDIINLDNDSLYGTDGDV